MVTSLVMVIAWAFLVVPADSCASGERGHTLCPSAHLSGVCSTVEGVLGDGNISQVSDA
jgi:hypothetical protein